MKFIYASFQGIHNNKATGMVKLLLPLVEHINNIEDVTYYVSSCRGYEGNAKIKNIGKGFKLVKIFTNIFDLMSNNKFIHVTRLLNEIVFDLQLSKKITEPTFLISTAYLRYSTKKNKKIGGINIFIAGNPHEREIYKCLKKEETYWNIKIADTYTFKKRLNIIEDCFNTYDHYLALTSSIYNTFKKQVNLKKVSFCNLLVMPNYSAFEKSNVKKRKKLTFCYIAHTVWLKGLQYLLRAFVKINSIDADLVIGGYLSESVIKFIDQTNLPKNIYLAGKVESLNNFYRSSHVCIVPSLLDGGPATITEALFCGLPVIATEGCGAKDIILNYNNGFIIPPANVEALHEKIIWFIRNTQQIQTMQFNAVNTIKEIKQINLNKRFIGHLKKITTKLK